MEAKVKLEELKVKKEVHDDHNDEDGDDAAAATSSPPLPPPAPVIAPTADDVMDADVEEEV